MNRLKLIYQLIVAAVIVNLIMFGVWNCWLKKKKKQAIYRHHLGLSEIAMIIFHNFLIFYILSY